MNASVIGLDIAKSVFALHGVDARGEVVLKKTLKRSQVLTFFAQQPLARIGLEACGGAHYWARELKALGHTVVLIAAQPVVAFRGKHKSDSRDAKAICTALRLPETLSVPINTPVPQDLQMTWSSLLIPSSEATFCRSRSGCSNAFGVT